MMLGIVVAFRVLSDYSLDVGSCILKGLWDSLFFTMVVFKAISMFHLQKLL